MNNKNKLSMAEYLMPESGFNHYEKYCDCANDTTGDSDDNSDSDGGKSSTGKLK